ncbi:MAG: PulJ/GspJ family protein, partial [Anaerohalosphaeraceae bacterium]
MKTPVSKKQVGFTMVEVLISLTILATLMAAVAFAFDAAVTNYQANKGIYETVNRGRQALLRMTNDLRTAQAVAFIGATVNDDPDEFQISMFTTDNRNITYKYLDSKLLYITNDDTTDPDYMLCENVTEATFFRDIEDIWRDVDPGAGIDYQKIPAVRNVRIVIKLTDDNGENPQTLVAATMI